LLRVESSFGLQFYSMADLITSGLTPGVVMYKLFLETGIRELNLNFTLLNNEFTFTFAPYALVGFLIPLGAAIRLSQFNVDSEQRFEFRGLPAPANALFIVSLPLLLAHSLFSEIRPFVFNYSALVAISLVSALLMNIRLPLFSFKIKSLSIQEYGYQFALLLFVFPTFYFFQWVAVPLLIMIYLILNVIRNSLS
jgi:CDP-diacylglycerol--serine O-phosphatidyltransferase